MEKICDQYDITDKFLNYSELMKHNEKIVSMFRQINYDHIADKINKCCKDTKFMVCPNCGTYHFVSTWNCKSKFCNVCAKKRYLIYLAKYIPIVQDYIKSGHRVLLVTLTLKNMFELDNMLNRFNVTFKKFREKYSLYYNNIDGALVSREITNIGHGWHVHMHCLFICKENYNYTDKEYCNLLKTDWLRKTGDSFQVDVKTVGKSNNDELRNKSILKSLCETFKYMTKLSQLNVKYLQELFDVTYKRRMISTVGCLYGQVIEDDVEKEINEKDTRDIANLVCAVCGLEASYCSGVIENTLEFSKTGKKVYRFKEKDINE